MTEVKKAPAPVEIVRELDDFEGRACLVKQGEDYYVVSSVNAMITGPETLVFRSDAEGEVAAWGEVAGGRGVSRQGAILELETEGARWYDYDDEDD